MSATGRVPGQLTVRPAIRRAAIFAVLAPLAIHAAWDYVEIRRLVHEIEAIETRGEPVNQAQAGKQPRQLSPEAERASSYYLAAAALTSTVFDDGDRTLLQPLDEWLAGGTAEGPDLDALNRRLAAIVASGAEALRLVERANRLAFDGFAPGTEYNYRTYQLADVSRLIAFRTLHEGFSDRGDEAAESGLHALGFRRTLRDVGWFWVAGHHIPGVLSVASPSPEALQRLQAALEQEDASFSLQQELARERAMHIDAVWRRYYGPDPDSPHVRSLPMRSVAETVWRPLFTHRFVSVLRRWAGLMEAARRPWPEKSEAMAAVFEKYAGDDTPPWFPFLAPRGLMRAAFWHSDVGAAGRLEAFVTDRCARTAVAVERFRRARGGDLPARLDDIVPAYLSEVPMDPYSGGPLRYVRDATSYTVYSVGPDREDHGGDLASALRAVIERGWGRRTIRGRDQGVRILIR